MPLVTRFWIGRSKCRRLIGMRLTFTRTPLLFIGCVLQAVVGVAAEPLSDSAANRFEALLVAVQGQRGVEMGTGGGDQLNCPPSQWGASYPQPLQAW